MTMVSVSSSNVSAIGYDNGTLHVSFKSGGLYSYTNVPESMYQNFLSADSKGRYFKANISGRYGEKKIH